MSTVKVALAQLEIAVGKPDANLLQARGQVARAQELGAQMVLLPELWSSGYDLGRASELGSPMDHGTFAEMAALAREFSVCLGGSALEAEDGRFFNTQVVYGPDGRRLAHYRKIHLFGLMNEPEFLSPGARPALAELSWGTAGMAVCYDLRFPEMFRSYALDGAQMLLLSAEWPHPRLEHWRTLLRARAIENQIFVAACNSVGEGNGNVFCGHSMIVDPWGEILVEAGEDATVVSAEIDLAQVAEIRGRYPFLADARADLGELVPR
jgi:omega-amidase